MSEKLPGEDYSDWHAVDPDKPLSTCACVHCELGRANQEIERLRSDLTIERAIAAGSTIKLQAEIERLKADAHEMRGLLETAHDAMEPMQRPPVSPSWLVAVGWIIEKGGDDE